MTNQDYIDDRKIKYYCCRVTGLRSLSDLYAFAAILWGCYLLAEQQTIALMMVIKSAFVSIITNLYISVMILVLGTGALR